MLTTMEQKRIRDLITETVTVLCQNSLHFKSKFTVEGLLGITIDDKEVFLINIHEGMSSKHSVVREKLVSGNTANHKKKSSSLSVHSLLESHDVADMSQSPETQTAENLPLSQTGSPEPWDVLPYHHLDDEIAQSFRQQAFHSEKLLPCGKGPIETNLSYPLGTDGNECISGPSPEVCDGHTVSVKEENCSGTDAMDCASHDLLMECTSIRSTKQNTNLKVASTPRSTDYEESFNFASSEEASAEPQYTVIPGGSARGGSVMISSDGYRYGIKMSKNNVTYWRCVIRNRVCNCRAVVIQRGNVFIRGIHKHSHSPHYISE